MTELTIIGWKVEGERPDGSYIEGDRFETREKAEFEIAMLLMEFADNEYWTETVWEVLI